MNRVKIGAIIAGLAGLGLAIALVVYNGYSDIFQAFEMAGWGLFLLVPLHVLQVGLDSRGWRILLRPHDPRHRAGWLFLLWAASVRDGVSNLLPVARVGGDLVGIRLVMVRGLSGAVTAASVLVEMSATTINQYLFAVMGLILLFYSTAVSPLLVNLAIGMLLALPAIVGLLVLLRYGSVFERLERLLEKVVGVRGKLDSMLGDASVLDQEIRAMYRRVGDLLRCALWQMAGLVSGALEIWLVLKLLNHPVGFTTPLILESMFQAVRHIAFMIPAGLGVQEAGFMVFGSMLGLGGDTAITLSLAKRMRELVYGAPMIVWWQWVEGKRLHSLFRRDRKQGSGNGKQETGDNW